MVSCTRVGLSITETKGKIMKRASAMRLVTAVLAAILAVGLESREVRAQAVVGGPFSASYRVSDYLGAPGLYGMSYGFASYGMPQTYSVFSAYPGASYGATLPPYGILPGRYGVGIWRPGFVAPGYVYGASYYYPPSSFSYRTFAVGTGPGSAGNRLAPPPPVGVYAPALGPSTLYGW
jgi:hypothetical protein